MKKIFPTLDAMRGIAALFVLLIHTADYWAKIHFKHSALVVDMFFILSGFVIAHAYRVKLFILLTEMFYDIPVRKLLGKKLLFR